MTCIKNFILICVALTILSSCASIYRKGGGKDDGFYGYYKVGNPYKINDKWYYPKEQPEYDETGIASWYGTDFDGKMTANGDTYDRFSLTAAHNTLPMPSMVRVTNLDNNKTIILMVNDRGPYSKGRVIDVSQRAAEILGFKEKGMAKVRVQFLQGQTKRLLSALPKGPSDSSFSFFKKDTPDINIADDEEDGPRDLMKPIKKLSQTTAPENETTPTNNPNITLASANTAKPAVRAQTVNNELHSELQQALAKEETLPQTLPPSPNKILPLEVKSGGIKSKELPGSITDTARTEYKTDPKIVEAAYAKTLPQIEAGPLNYIQAGTYSMKKNAERAKESLRSLGDVAITPLARGNTVLYRVRVGPLPDIKLAKLTLEEIIKSGHADAILISETATNK